MALDFPDSPQPGESYIDDCGNEWIYNAVDNSWTINPPAFDFPDVDPDSIWARANDGTITPINADDVLNMGTQNSDINLSDFPETF